MEGKVSKRVIIGAVAATAGLALAHGASAGQTPKWAKKGTKMVKCAGVVKTGMNDCSANDHGCTGGAKKDGDPNEWIFLPDEVCKKLVNGTVKAEKKKKKG